MSPCFGGGNLKEREKLEDLSVDESWILQSILKQSVRKGVEGIDIGSAKEKMSEYCDLHAETSVSIKCKEIFDKLRLKNYPCIRGSVGSNSIIPAETARYIDNL
jgi:hypothetical protein